MNLIQYPIRPDTVIASSSANNAFRAMLAIDGYTDCMNGGAVKEYLWKSNTGLPQTITMDLGKVYGNIDILGYLPRQNTTDISGRINGYTILVSTDTQTFSTVTSGTFSGTDRSYKTVMFSPQVARYVRLQIDSCYGADGISPGTFVTISELDVGGFANKPTTGVLARNSQHSTRIPDQSILVSSGNKIVIPEKYRAETNKVSIYNSQGKLLYGPVSPQKAIDYGKISKKITGIYLVKVLTSLEK
jgi:hypothetical protein